MRLLLWGCCLYKRKFNARGSETFVTTVFSKQKQKSKMSFPLEFSFCCPRKTVWPLESRKITKAYSVSLIFSSVSCFISLFIVLSPFVLSTEKYIMIRRTLCLLIFPLRSNTSLLLLSTVLVYLFVYIYIFFLYYCYSSPFLVFQIPHASIPCQTITHNYIINIFLCLLGMICQFF